VNIKDDKILNIQNWIRIKTVSLLGWFIEWWMKKPTKTTGRNEMKGSAIDLENEKFHQ